MAELPLYINIYIYILVMFVLLKTVEHFISSVSKSLCFGRLFFKMDSSIKPTSQYQLQYHTCIKLNILYIEVSQYSVSTSPHGPDLQIIITEQTLSDVWETVKHGEKTWTSPAVTRAVFKLC